MLVRSCKLYHKTTWFETILSKLLKAVLLALQIISQNYVVWNFLTSMLVLWFIPLQIISQNYVVWNTPWLNALAKGLKLQIISQNYVVWNLRLIILFLAVSSVANYITKLRGLKRQSRSTSRSIVMLQIISQNYVVWNFRKACSSKSLSALQIISQNYVVWNKRVGYRQWRSLFVANYITKLRGLKPLALTQLLNWFF